ncbi:Ceramide synthase 1 LOH3 [Linum grandiflorum]
MDSLLPSSSIDWDSESYPSASDFVAIPFFAVFFPLLRLFLDRFLFQKVAVRLILRKGDRSSIDLATREERKTITKFKESAWKLVYFFSADVLALYVSHNETWFVDTKCFYAGPGDQVWPDLKTKLKLKGLYMYGSGFYVYSTFALMFWETRRSDFLVSMGHHLATLALLLLSYMARFSRVGAIVLAIHDATDMFLEPAKMARYGGFESLSGVLFAIFVLVWTMLRIVCFPFWILRSTSTEIIRVLDVEKHSVAGPVYYYLFNTLLICLLVVNVYWWKLMIAMVIEQIKSRGKLGDDIRSDSEDEDDHVD